MRVEFLTSTPPTPIEGSGTFVGVDGLMRGLTALGHEVWLRPLSRRTGFHTLDRWLYNAGVRARPPAADVVVGVDLDGFLWASRRPRHDSVFVVALKGIIADELRNERGVTRALLRLQARWERRNAAMADRVIVPSRYSAAVATAVYDVPADRLAVVPEPIDLAAWSRRLAVVRRRPREGPTVLSVARMYPRKRLDDLLQAALLLQARIRDLRIRIVGDGPERSRLQACHRALGLGATVTWIGAVDAATLAVEYVSADCFCLPTVQESFGLVFAEAMAAGLAIVACRAGAVPEIVQDRRTGLLVNPRSPEELAMALQTLLHNEGLRRDLADAGRKAVQAFDSAPVARRFLEAIGR